MRPLLLACTVALFIALGNLPIGYYTFLRILVTIGALAVIFSEYQNGSTSWIILFLLVAILFNPILPIYLGRKSAWVVPDLLAGLLFLGKFLIKFKPIAKR